MEHMLSNQQIIQMVLFTRKTVFIYNNWGSRCDYSTTWLKPGHDSNPNASNPGLRHLGFESAHLNADSILGLSHVHTPVPYCTPDSSPERIPLQVPVWVVSGFGADAELKSALRPGLSHVRVWGRCRTQVRTKAGFESCLGLGQMQNSSLH